MAKECTQPRNMANVQCRNCDEMGHDSKGCSKPKDSKHPLHQCASMRVC